MRGLVVSGILSVLAGIAVWCVATGEAGPDPAKWLLHQTGFFALAFLVATLSVSTLARALRRPHWVLWRRPVGLASFAAASAHVFVYLTFYQGLSWSAVLDDVGKRPYIIIGLAAWLLLLPLAVTSTRTARRRMGNAWSRLHRTVYLIVPLAILHQGMAQKADLAETLIFSAFTVCFLIERAVRARR